MKTLPIIGHFRQRYLPATETFIYQYLTHFSKIKPVVFAEEVMNLDKFPFSDIKIYFL